MKTQSPSDGERRSLRESLQTASTTSTLLFSALAPRTRLLLLRFPWRKKCYPLWTICGCKSPGCFNTDSDGTPRHQDYLRGPSRGVCLFLVHSTTCAVRVSCRKDLSARQR